MSRPTPSRLLSAVFLVLATFLGWLGFYPPMTLIRSVAPASARDADDIDPTLRSRVNKAWPQLGPQVAERFGNPGLLVLDRMGPEGGHCWEQTPSGFAQLADFARREPHRLDVVCAWRRALPDWARSGRLPVFLNRVAGFSEQQLEIARRVPAALPLLLEDDMPATHEVLRLHGERAWTLLLPVNHLAFPEHVEYLAKQALQDDLILAVNDQFGLAVALLFVPSTEDGPLRGLAILARHVWKHLPPEEAATFLVGSASTLVSLLEAGKTPDELCQAIDRFRALPELTRELALDHFHTLRLLCEVHDGKPLGAEALRRCGPEAADLLYGVFASEIELKRPALMTLAHLGLDGLFVLDRFRTHGPFFKLLRRADRELMDGSPPLVLDVIGHIGQAGNKGQQKIDEYLSTPNLRASLAADRFPPSPNEDLLEYFPGYTTYRTTNHYLQGRRVTSGDVAWATLDAANSALVMKNVLQRAASSVALKVGGRGASRTAIKGTKTVLRALRTGARTNWEELTKRNLDRADTLQKLDELRQRYGDNPQSWPAEARQELQLLLQATPGVTAAMISESKKVQQALPLTVVLERARPTARLIGVELWAAQSGPLVEHDVLRVGGWQKYRPDRLKYLQETESVGEFAVSLLEAGPHVQPEPTVAKTMVARETSAVSSTPLAPEIEKRCPLWLRLLLLFSSALFALLAFPGARHWCGQRLRRVTARGGRQHQPLRE